MRAVLWCNGSIPSQRVIESTISDGDKIFGVDGGADKALECGFQVMQAIGDMDSIETKNWDGRLSRISDQSCSDLVKSISFLIDGGFTEIEVIGIDGGSQSHILGNWAALCEAPGGALIRLHHEEYVTHRIHPMDGKFEMEMGLESKFSIFALEPGMVWLKGAKWEMSGEVLSFSTRGLNNEGMGKVVSIKSESVLAIVMQRLS